MGRWPWSCPLWPIPPPSVHGCDFPKDKQSEHFTFLVYLPDFCYLYLSQEIYLFSFKRQSQENISYLTAVTPNECFLIPNLIYLFIALRQTHRFVRTGDWKIFTQSFPQRVGFVITQIWVLFVYLLAVWPWEVTWPLSLNFPLYRVRMRTSPSTKMLYHYTVIAPGNS